MTANPTNDRRRTWTVMESSRLQSNVLGRWQSSMEAKPAVFKTVCGALLRRPGWVRFPSIPATSLAVRRWEVSPRTDAASSGLRSARLDSVREAEPAQEALLARERHP